ncbi:uncharacterized protein LOC118734724 [Rhagoletis pomonella]|uniref:uncharacterized protein LOC118734724 n=1 Tax=Rhagoletis pomonella TaxID=28610 RepID=UPI00177CBD45|nr:uncharacterized protein LOC118734724 [Rhagoletis pomonella]
MESEMVINSRPLTYVPISDYEDEALTPNHFLLGNSVSSKPMSEVTADGLTLRRGWLASQQLANSFWTRWLKEYLPIITRRSKWFENVKPIEVGDVVLIADPNSPRNCWPKGRVIDVRRSVDGQVRSATVKTITGLYERPATKLAVLDLKALVEPSQDTPGGSVARSGNVFGL